MSVRPAHRGRYRLTTAALLLALAASASASAPIRGHTQVPDRAAAKARVPVALAFFTARDALLAGTDGTLLASDTGGRSWRRAGRLALEQIDVVTATLAYATTKRALLRTDDAGRHWQLAAHVAGAVSFADRLHGWISVGTRS